MQSEKYSKSGALVTAIALALDQRIGLQVVAVVVLCIFFGGQGMAWGDIRKAMVLLAIISIYILANTLMMYVGVESVAAGSWAAPFRVFLYYLMFVLLWWAMRGNIDKAEFGFVVLELLFWIKVVLLSYEGGRFLLTGSFSDRPLFNIVIAPDSLLGVRFTSSYDILFSLLVFSPRRQLYRFIIVVAVNLLCETRLVLLMTLLFMSWRILRGKVSVGTLLVCVVSLLLAVGVAIRVANVEGTSSRLTQISGSSLDDKLEQLVAVQRQITLPCIVVGCGLGSSLSGITRDESRPYSYEAQVPVLLIQGGVLFFIVHVYFVTRYIRRRGVLAISLLMLASVTNPLLFSLASVFFLTTFGYACDSEKRTN